MAHAIGDCQVRFGIAGWSYPDWQGIVYPAGVRDRLRWLAGFVDLIEVNVTFYAFLAPHTAADWLSRTADLVDLRWSAKAHQAFTHGPPAGFGAAEVLAFARGVEPLREAGRLVALLFQFPFGFRYGADARQRLESLARAFAGWPLVLEVRHRGWDEPGALAFVADLGFSVAGIDLPRGSATFSGEHAATGEPGYLRLHGRNAPEWFRRDAGRDARYDYLYGDDELEEIAGRIETLARRFRELVIVTNNHYRGQALANLAELVPRTGGPGRVPLPASLVRAFPRLAAVACPVEHEPTRVGSRAEGPHRRAGPGSLRAGEALPPEDAQGELFGEPSSRGAG